MPRNEISSKVFISIQLLFSKRNRVDYEVLHSATAHVTLTFKQNPKQELVIFLPLSKYAHFSSFLLAPYS